MANLIIDKVLDNFTIIQNSAIESNLSDSAFRVWSYLKSRPSDWITNNKDIKSKLNYGDDKIAKIWKELIYKGWIIRRKIYKQSKFIYEYTLPIAPDNAVIHSPVIHSPVKSGTVDFRDYNNTNALNNTNINNIKKYIKKENIEQNKNNNKLNATVLSANADGEPIKLTLTNAETIIEYFNQVTNSKLKTNSQLVKNINTILKEFTIKDFKLVIDFIANDKYYIDNDLVKLSVISRITKFHEKLEKAQSSSFKTQHHVF